MKTKTLIAHLPKGFFSYFVAVAVAVAVVAAAAAVLVVVVWAFPSLSFTET